MAHLRRALAPQGTLAIVGGEARHERWLWGFGRQLSAPLLSPFVGHKLRSVMAVTRKEDLMFLRELIEAGKITPVIDRTYPLAEAPAAIRYLAEGHARGKVVLAV